SEELAEQLFHSGNVTGLQVEIGGEAFVIAGVFAKAASVLTSMADDNVPDLFMPVTTWLDQHPEGKITTMELAVIQDNNHDFAISERLTAAFIAAGKDPPTRYVITNFSKEYEMANSKSHMLEIVMGIACMWIVVRVAWRCLRTAVLLFTQDLQLNEPLDIWRQNWRIIAPQFLGLLVSCGVLAWMASRMSQPFYVDPEWIPQRLIDLSFYKARVEEYWQEKQTMLGYIPSQVELYKDRLNLLMTVIHIGLFTLVGVICSWLLADLAGIDYLINWHIVGLILVFLVYHKWFARRNNSL
ncbi:MAG: hypothetical protein K0R67_2334, partial [Paenibacillus sp.]|nr:hypothetical protein [Paenibacillus sp.]